MIPTFYIAIILALFAIGLIAGITLSLMIHRKPEKYSHLRACGPLAMKMLGSTITIFMIGAILMFFIPVLAALAMMPFAINIGLATGWVVHVILSGEAPTS